MQRRLTCAPRAPQALHALALVTCLALAAPALAQDHTGTLELDGQTIGAGMGPRNHAEDYTSPDKVKVTYTIATKMVDGKKVFDPANSKVVMRSDKWRWSTVDIPLTEVQGDPATGKITGFKFDAPTWYKNAPNGLVDKGIKGSVTIDAKGKADGDIEAKYEDKTGKTKSGYTFTTVKPKPADPKAAPPATGGKPLSAASAVGSPSGLRFDAATGRLSIHDDAVVGTPMPNDPLLGAALSFPDFELQGFNTSLGLAVFWAVGDPVLTAASGLTVHERSRIPALFYDTSENLFFAPLFGSLFGGMSSSSAFYDPTLSGQTSPFLDAAASVLDPDSPYYDPFAALYMTLTPDTDFGALTAGFTVSGQSGATDAHLVSTAPEPATVALLAAGLALVGAVAGRGRRGAATRRLARGATPRSC
jgi:hypothetical protein